MKLPDEYKRWDIFVSHASEDKFIAGPLARKLSNHFRVWYDEFELNVGHSLNESITHGLKNSRFGVVIISPAFIRKKWTRNELNALIATETATEQRILPIWHNVSESDVKHFNAILADRVALCTTSGINELASTIARRIPRLGSHGFWPSNATWTGATGRLNLTCVGNTFVGEYDWHTDKMVGQLIGTLSDDNAFLLFNWEEPAYNKRGNGFFYIDERPIKGHYSCYLHGAWADQGDDIDFGTCIVALRRSFHTSYMPALREFLIKHGVSSEENVWSFSHEYSLFD